MAVDDIATRRSRVLGGYTASRSWDAYGARVSIVTCLECGAAVTIDPADDKDFMEVHRLWHQALREEAQGVRPHPGLNFIG